METSPRFLQNALPVGFAGMPSIAEHIRHHDGREQCGITERQAADGAQLLFELTRHAGIEREMAGVVRPRCQFVYREGSVPEQEQFDRDEAYHVERFGDFFRQSGRLCTDVLGQAGGNDGQIEDMIAVDVLARLKTDRVPEDIPGAHHGQFR